MFEVLAHFLKGDTPYKPGDITWIEKEKFERLKKEGKVKEYKETKFYPLEKRTVEVEEKIYGKQKPIPRKPKEEELICPICQKRYKTKKWVKKHLKEKHGIIN